MIKIQLRPSARCLCLILLLILVTTAKPSLLWARDGMRAPPKPAPVSESRAFDALDFYQSYISPVDGDRCQMQPSCSHYAHTALKTQGLFKGLLMSADRIMRCGNDTKHYQKVWLEYRYHYLDEVDITPRGIDK